VWFVGSLVRDLWTEDEEIVGSLDCGDSGVVKLGEGVLGTQMATYLETGLGTDWRLLPASQEWRLAGIPCPKNFLPGKKLILQTRKCL
jgi:hypothetical protein